MTGDRYRRRRRRGRRFKPTRLIVFICVLIAGYFAYQNIPRAADKQIELIGFCEGVYINGTAMAGMSYEDGLKYVSDKLDERISGITYEIRYNEQKWKVTGSELGARVDRPIEELVRTAWDYGRVGTPEQQREEIARLKDSPVYLESQIMFNDGVIKTITQKLKSKIDVDPVDSQMELGDNGKLVFSESAVGYRIDEEKLEQQMETAIGSGTGSVIEIIPEVVEPKVSKEKLEGEFEMLADVSTSLKNSTSNRNTNIKLALNYFNKMVVEPGQTVSFNKTVGVRTENRGFVKAPEFLDGTVTEGIGGGVCQASTTLYNAVLRAGLKIVERRSHSMKVGYVDYSMDATVSDQGSRDFVFKNGGNTPVYILTNVTKDRVRIKIFGTPLKYKIEIDYKLLEIIPPEGYRTKVDYSGKYAKYTDELGKLYSKGENGARSEGYRIFIDRVTGEEVHREVLSRDSYMPKLPVYWVGATPREIDEGFY